MDLLFESSAQAQRYRWPAAGCGLEPISNYLKALGLLRLLPGAKGWWEEGRFWIECDRPASGAIDFLANEVELSPIVSPWNGTSGLWKANQLLSKLSSHSRTARLVRTIEQARNVVVESGLKKQPAKGETKTQLIQACQAQLTDSDWQLWCDSALTLVDISTSKKTTTDFIFSRLLGTGGNVGAKDLGFNYLEAWSLLIDLSTGEAADNASNYWRAAILGSSDRNSLSHAALLAQYAPATDYIADAKVYPYQKSGGGSTAMVNPADAVLLTEGLMAFSGIAKRKLEIEGSSTAHYSLAVNLAAGIAETSVSGELRAGVEEFWLPLWDRPKSFDILKNHLLEELSGPLPNQATPDSFDFVKMLVSKAKERKIPQWQRYAFFPRKGQSNFAVSLGVFTPSGFNLGADLDGYRRALARFSYSDGAPAGLSNLTRQLEKRLFSLASGHGKLLPLLALLGEIELYLARSPGSQEKVKPVLQLAPDWVDRALAEHQSPTIRLAVSLASLWLRSRVSNARPGKGGRWFWAETPIQWGHDLTTNLIHLQRQWVTDADQGRDPYPTLRVSPTFADLSAFLAGAVNPVELTRLAVGFSLCKLPAGLGFQSNTSNADLIKLPALYTLAAYCQWSNVGIGSVLNLLAQGNSSSAAADISQRLRANSLSPFTVPSACIHSRQCAAALAFPFTQSQLSLIKSYLLEN